MKAVPFTRVSGILPLVRFLEEVGAPVERLAHQSGICSRLFDDPEAAVPLHLAAHFYGRSAQALACPNLGARVGRRSSSFELGIFGEIVRRCGTVYEALQASAGLVHQFATGHHDWIEEEPDRIWYCMGLADGVDLGLRQVQTFVLQMTLHTLELLFGPDWQPPAIRLPDHGQAWVDGLELACPVDVDPSRRHVAIAIPRHLLSLRLPSPPASAAVGSGRRQRLDETAQTEDFASSVCLALRWLLAEGCPSVDLAAEAAGMCARTFQRRLHEEGLTFSKLLDRCRMEAARELLLESDVKAIDVAYDLGYSDPGNFCRAFRRWSGITPREFRRQAAIAATLPVAQLVGPAVSARSARPVAP